MFNRRLLRNWLETGQRALTLLLPPVCLLCGAQADASNCCDACRADLPLCHPCCARCALPGHFGTTQTCPECLRSKPPWQVVIAGLRYEYPVDQLVARFKFRADFAAGSLLAAMLLRESERRQPRLDGLVPVPLHRLRALRRGFNQAGELSRKLGQGLDVEVLPDLLTRRRATDAQSGLDKARRRLNVAGAFSCEKLAGEHLGLVDDVLTTGATLAECCQTLTQAGAGSVTVLVAARVAASRLRGRRP